MFLGITGSLAFLYLVFIFSPPQKNGKVKFENVFPNSEKKHAMLCAKYY